jgi:hypothetical protein
MDARRRSSTDVGVDGSGSEGTMVEQASDDARTRAPRRGGAHVRERVYPSVMMPRGLVTILSLMLSATPLSGQIVRGIVVDEGTQAPVEGAMVVLLRPDGTVVYQVLSDENGGFIVDAGDNGTYVVRIDRIGYESITTESFDVPAEGLFKRIDVPIRPVELVGLDVEGSRRCEVRPEEGRATARVWEEARKALAAAALTLESQLYRYTLLHFRRELDADARRVLDETRDFQRGRAGVPYVSAPTAELLELGFMRRNEDGSFTYFAPDAGSFLSDPFLDTHCMKISRVQEGSIGLDFEPVSGRRVSDIQGTLWIEAATAKLQRLEFRYVNLPPGHEIGGARGQVVFGQLPTGSWIVRDWSITMPRLAYANRGGARDYIRIGYLQEGGVVWRVHDREGATVIEASTATIAGTVLDSLGTRPLAGAVVRVPEAGAEDATANAGTFLLPGLAEGLQTLEVSHPQADPLGLGPFRTTAVAVLGEATSVRIRIPGSQERLDEACGPDLEPARRSAILFGRVSLAGDGAPGATVRLLWLAAGRRDLQGSDRAAPPRETGDDAGPRWRPSAFGEDWIETTLDGRSIFIFCRIPGGSQVRISIPRPDGSETERTVTVPRGAKVVTVTVDISRR